MSDANAPSVTVHLARHGEVDAAWRGTVYGRLDAPLSARGLAQSRAMARALQGVELDAVVSSGLERAETAAALIRQGRRGLVRADDPRFLELDRGDWARRRVEDLRREDPEGHARWARARGAIRAPGGEDPAEVQGRVVPAVDEWARHAADKAPEGRPPALAVVAHLWVVRAVICHALGLPMDRSGTIALRPGTLVEVRWPLGPGGRPELVMVGR